MRKIVSFYRYIHLNQPRLTTLAGVVLILSVGTVHLVEASRTFGGVSAYLSALFAANFLGCLAAAFLVPRGTVGWTLGAGISSLSIVLYLASRVFGLPAEPATAGDWDAPLGSLASLLEAAFVAGWFSVITGLAAAYPDRRNWDD